MTKGIVIAAPHSGSGKTVFTMGLARALKAKGLTLEIAKGGPGFIDPQFLSAATEQACHNVDKWAMGPSQLRARVGAISSGKDMLLVEGMMGMFDGAAGMNGSTADVADTLDLPVLLLVDASGQAQSIAALVHGFATLRERPEVCGVVATRVGSQRHGEMLKDAMEETGIPFLGAVLRSEELHIPSRHLGLVQATESLSSADLFQAAEKSVAEAVDLDRLMDLAGEVKPAEPVAPLPPLGRRMAIAKDIAFEFAYPHQILDWRQQGAEISFFSPLADEAPSSDCDAVFLPGGYPELHCQRLASNEIFLSGLKAAAERGTLIYGECGGYMVLGEALIDADGTSHKMAGLLSHVTSFAERQMHLGYRRLEPLQEAPWSRRLNGHEFHYSKLVEPGMDAALFRASDATGTQIEEVGGQRGSVMGSYMHIIDVAAD